MRIGIVTTWFERGAAYVSRAYMQALQLRHDVFIYARGGEEYAIGDKKWDLPNVTWARKSDGFRINTADFKTWVKNSALDIVFFNEQQDWQIVLDARKEIPELILGSYVDYYTEKTIPWYGLYDFIICNTKRHAQAMAAHHQMNYIPWGVDINLFQPTSRRAGSPLTFFHSAGMSKRKGTDLLLDAFIEGKLGKSSQLIVHTQQPLNWATPFSDSELKSFGIEIVKKTVTAPGLYHLGDVYVYPTRLDGLGLTMYEALACGMPVITTDYPPMNEIIDKQVGELVRVERNYARNDAYYWPMSICDKSDLLERMYSYIDNPSKLSTQSKAARKKIENEYDWQDRCQEICTVFENVHRMPPSNHLTEYVKTDLKRENFEKNFGWSLSLLSKMPRLKRAVKRHIAH